MGHYHKVINCTVNYFMVTTSWTDGNLSLFLSLAPSVLLYKVIQSLEIYLPLTGVDIRSLSFPYLLCYL